MDSNSTHLLAHSSVSPKIHLDSMLKASPSQNEGSDQAKLLSRSSEVESVSPAHTGGWQSPVLCSCRSEVLLSLLADQALISANKTLPWSFSHHPYSSQSQQLCLVSHFRSLSFPLLRQAEENAGLLKSSCDYIRPG